MLWTSCSLAKALGFRSNISQTNALRTLVSSSYVLSRNGPPPRRMSRQGQADKRHPDPKGDSDIDCNVITVLHVQVEYDVKVNQLANWWNPRWFCAVLQK